MAQTSTDEPGSSMPVFTNGKQQGAQLGGSVSDRQKERFGTYFPRLFACVYSLIGDEAVAKVLVSEAFSRVLPGWMDNSEDEFVIELFATARDLIRSSPRPGPATGSLSERERELLAFVFDARLTRDQIRRLTDATEPSVSTGLLRALRKIQTESASTAAVSASPAQA
jgi:hypothetical protein